MDFLHTFFEDEVREGFYISGIIKRNWAAQMEVLSEIDRVCKTNNIKWFAAYGTLLGAVRHGGYIPWDDDLDIYMLRKDYNAFLDIACRQLPDGYRVLHPGNFNEDYLQFMARVVNNHGLCFEDSFLEKYHQCPYAVGVDIFPLDNIPDDAKDIEQQMELMKFGMYLADQMNDDGSNYKEYELEIRKLAELLNTQVDVNMPIRHQIFLMVEAIFQSYKDKGGSYVAWMPDWVNNGYKYNAGSFDRCDWLKFENMQLPIPRNYTDILEEDYGDYKKIVKGGGAHEYPCFEKQEDYFRKLVSKYPFKYNFNIDDLKNEDRILADDVKIKTYNFVNSICTAHNEIVSQIDNSDVVLDLFALCQEYAIQIGGLLEKRFGMDLQCVRVLEQYCEMIYQISQCIMENDTKLKISEKIETNLCNILHTIEDEINRLFDRKKQVLFITMKASAWNVYEDLWRKMKSDPQLEASVMPIPYYERLAKGQIGKEHFEGNALPDYVETIDYKTYNMEKQHPDMIVIQNAYDACNYTTTISPELYSDKLKKYTDMLVYIPWFIVDEIEPDCGKDKKVMQYYCSVPGVINADYVVVQSDRMRRAYIDYLSEFAGEETRTIWEDKIKSSWESIFN